jgi:hypothetical protein
MNLKKIIEYYRNRVFISLELRVLELFIFSSALSEFFGWNFGKTLIFNWGLMKFAQFGLGMWREKIKADRVKRITVTEI